MDTGGWGERYAAGSTPWDLGRPHPELLARLGSGALAPPFEGARALVAGAGRGHDAGALAQAGWHVTALELVPALAPDLAQRVGAEGTVVIADALAWRGATDFQLVFEHTFFCALEPELRPRWGELVRSALARDATALLAAVVFPIGKPPQLGGPPFGVESSQLAAALGDGARVLTDEPVQHGVSRRSYPERWLELRVAGLTARRSR